MSDPAPFESLTLDELRARSSIKWQRYPPDVLPLWVAEMDAPPVPSVVEAVTAAVRSGDLGYPPGDHAYAESFAAMAARHWGWTFDPQAAVPVADVLTGVREALLATTTPGDAVLLPTPVYHPLVDMPGEIGRRLVSCSLTAEGRLDLSSIAAALEADRGIRALLLCSPHNPTGVVHTADELDGVAQIAAEFSVEVVVDEIHSLLVVEGSRFVPWLAVSDVGVVVTSASKAYNMAAIKAGVLITGSASTWVRDRLPVKLPWGASHLGGMAHRAAWDRGDAWLGAVNSNIAASTAYLAQLLAEQLPGVRYLGQEATYLAWLDCRELGLGDDPAARFLERGRVALSPGPEFGPGGEGFARMNLACSRAVLAEAVQRMASVPG
jgi:cysteine-S-conjugate beta-lyase